MLSDAAAAFGMFAGVVVLLITVVVGAAWLYVRQRLRMSQ